MIDVRSQYRVGALFIALSGLLHISALVLSGFAPSSFLLGGVGVLWLFVAVGLLRNMRWLAYLAFLLAMIGGIAALSGAWTAGPVPHWVYLGIATAHLGAVLALFVALWRPALVEVTY